MRTPGSWLQAGIPVAWPKRQSPRVGDFLVPDRHERRAAKRGGQPHRQRLAFDHEPRERTNGRRVTLVVGDGLERVSCRPLRPLPACRHVDPAPSAGFRPDRSRICDPVMGNGMQLVSLERHMKVVLVAGVDDPPALDLAGSHANDRVALTIDGEKTWRRPPAKPCRSFRSCRDSRKAPR